MFYKAGAVSDIIYRPEKKDCTQYVLDISKTIKDLDYRPQYDWKKYLQNLKWHIENEPNADVWGKFEDYYKLLR